MKKITYKQISEMINKSEITVQGWKKAHPNLLELVKLGATVKEYNISEEQLQLLVKLLETSQDIKH